MHDYRVPKSIGGFNPQKLYTEILKSESTDIWKVQKLEDKTLIANGSALYIVPGKFSLADDFIEGTGALKVLTPRWEDGAPCVDTRSEMALSNKTVAKVFRINEEDFYFNKMYFKYFTDDTFEYRMSGNRSKSLYVAYKGELIALILGINISK